MNRPQLVALALVAACTKPHLGGALATIAFDRGDDGPACIRVVSTDAATLNDASPLQSSVELVITDRGRSGEVAVAIGRKAGWSTRMNITASLHLRTCASDAVASQTQPVTIAPNTISAVAFTLNHLGVSDGGPTADAGRPDAGTIDAGGADAGPADAGPADAGSTDSGTPSLDAGPRDAGAMPGDAGRPDAGQPDAGPGDAGSCTGTFSVLPSPLATQFNAVAMFDVGTAMLAGESGSIRAGVRLGDGGTTFQDWSSAACFGTFQALFVKSQALVYAVTERGRVDLFTAIGTCSPNQAFVDAGTVSAIAAYPIMSETRVWVSTANPGGIGGITLNTQGSVIGATDLFVGDAGLTSSTNNIFDVAGTSDSNVFAVGISGSNGFILKLDTGLHRWVPITLPAATTSLRTIAFADATHGYAAGQKLYLFDGASWVAGPNPPFEVFDLKALGVNNVLAVGAATDGMGLGIARFNGMTWARLAAPMTMTTSTLLKIDANGSCDVVAVGPDATILRSRP